MPTAAIDIQEIHDVAGVPDGAEIISYDWTQHGLTIKYES